MRGQNQSIGRSCKDSNWCKLRSLQQFRKFPREMPLAPVAWSDPNKELEQSLGWPERLAAA